MKFCRRKLRVVKRGESEFEAIQTAAHKLMETEIGSQIFFSYCEGFFGVLQYAPGHPLMGLEGNQVLRSSDPEMMRELGRLCALDVLVNNLDRIPLPVWQNEGNLGNVMVVNGGKSIVGIDQQVNFIMPGPGRDRYTEKVRTIVLDASPCGDPTDIVAKIRQVMLENCGAELSDAACQNVVVGLREGFESIRKAWNSGDLKRALDQGEEACLDRLTMQGKMWVVKPELATLRAMNEFVCSIAALIAACADLCIAGV